MARSSAFLMSRRTLIRGGLGGLVAWILVACGRQATVEANPGTVSNGLVPSTATTSVPQPMVSVLPPTPACADDEPTPAQTEGPFYTPETPEKANFLADVDQGIPLLLSGSVVDTSCNPVKGALLDFWHADDHGNYDNSGFKLRGHQFPDDAGSYRLDTIVPGLYPGRTRHIHVRVQPPGGEVLTTQLYFPDEPANASDGIFSADLVMRTSGGDDLKEGFFNFVLGT